MTTPTTPPYADEPTPPVADPPPASTATPERTGRQRSRRKVLVASTVAGLAGLTGGMAMASGRTPTTTATTTAPAAATSASGSSSTAVPGTEDAPSASVGSSSGPVITFGDDGDAYGDGGRRGPRSAVPPSGTSRPGAPSTSSQGS